MKAQKKARLEEAGWKVGSAADFLELTEEESAFVELKLALADLVRALRTRKRMTQEQAAKLLGSSQSRIAKMEAADTSVSLDLLVRSALALGASRQAVAKAISARAA